MTLQQRIIAYLKRRHRSVETRSAYRTAQALHADPASVSSLLRRMVRHGFLTRYEGGGPRGGYVYYLNSLHFHFHSDEKMSDEKMGGRTRGSDESRRGEAPTSEA